MSFFSRILGAFGRGGSSSEVKALPAPEAVSAEIEVSERGAKYPWYNERSSGMPGYQPVRRLGGMRGVWNNLTTTPAEALVRCAHAAYACTNLHATEVSSIGLMTELLEGSVYRRIDQVGEAQLIFDRVEDMTSTDFLTWIDLNLLLSGECFLHKIRYNGPKNALGRRPVGALDPLHSGVMQPVANSNYTRIIRYDFTRWNGKTTSYSPEDIIHLKHVVGSTTLRGAGPVAVARVPMETAIQSVNWNRSQMSKSVGAKIAFAFKEPISNAQHTNITDQIETSVSGSENAGRPIVFGGSSGVSIHKLFPNPKDMDWIAGQKLTEVQMCVVFNTPPNLIGVLDRATYNNFAEALRWFRRSNVAPSAKRIVEQINLGLKGELPASEDGRRVYFDFDSVPGLNTLSLEQVNQARIMAGLGFSLEAVNRRVGLGMTAAEVQEAQSAREALGELKRKAK